MKYLICSDIHGCVSACKKIIFSFESLKCDKIIFLGDILYHGPRNPLPENYDPKGVIELLNNIKDKIIACRGNCDAEVDQMVLNFSIMSDYVQIIDNSITLFCTHGHVYSPFVGEKAIVEGAHKPLLEKPAVIFFGHTHISLLEKNEEGVIFCNPGSISIPKNNTEAGFATFENKKITLYNINQNVIKELEIR